MRPGALCLFGAGEDALGTMTCFVTKNHKLYALTCAHNGAKTKAHMFSCIDGGDTAIKSEQVNKENHARGNDAALYSIPHDTVKKLTQDNFRVGTTSTEITSAKGLVFGDDQKPKLNFFAAKSNSLSEAMGNGRVGAQKVTASDIDETERFMISSEDLKNQRGDSGSPVYTDDGALCGMMHMGSVAGGDAFVIRMDHIFRVLGVELATWDNRLLWMPADRTELRQSSDSVSDGEDSDSDSSDDDTPFYDPRTDPNVTWNTPVWDKKV